MSESITLTREWMSLLGTLLSDTARWNVLQAVMDYATDGTESCGLDGDEMRVFVIIKQRIKNRKCKANYLRKKRHENSTVESTVESTPFELESSTVESTVESKNNSQSTSSNQHIDTINTPSCKSKDLLCSPKGEEKKKFAPPTLDDVIEYCKQRRNAVDAEQFHAFYSANNWMVGHGNKMKDWKAAVRYWERSMYMRRKKLTETRDYSGI